MTQGLAKKYRERIQREWQESDGYWIDLKAGFKNGNDPLGCVHGIVEESRYEAYRVLRDSMACDCAECTYLLAHRTVCTRCGSVKPAGQSCGCFDNNCE